MAGSAFQHRLTSALQSAGVTLNGPNPWDIQVRDPRLYRRVAIQGTVGLGDAYVEGWWDCPALDQLYDRVLRADLPAHLWFSIPCLSTYLYESIFNAQSKPRSRKSIRAHYDLGRDVFAATLDSRMVYTCAFWDGANTLDEAQENKLDLVCRKLDLRPGHTVLDLGCGWGGFAQFAAERYGCRVLAVTLSRDQADAASERCRGLPVEVRLQDYRDVQGKFDRIASIGMMEHVGPKNYRGLMELLRRHLTDDGLALLHFFATQRSWPNLRDSEILWIKERIFPGLVVPSLPQIGNAVGNLMVLEDVHNFGAHYDPTLIAWFENFERNWPSLQTHYGDQFFRLWRYYLLSCAGAFRSRKYQLWQIVLSPRGVRGGYRRPSEVAEHINRPESVSNQRAARDPATVHRSAATG